MPWPWIILIGKKMSKKTKKTLSEYEKEFKTAQKLIVPKVKEQLKIAREALNKIQKLSEKVGIPIKCDISPITQNYVPKSFSKNIDHIETLIKKEYDKNPKDCKYDDITDFLDYNDLSVNFYGIDDYGWEHSAACW